MFVFGLLFLPIFLPFVGASSQWKEDGWLDADWYTKDGRIASGDELGCQGMPHLNLEIMPKTTARECKEYLTERTNSSRWGKNPLSFGIDLSENPNFDSSDHEALFSEGFSVHGLDTNYQKTVWHHEVDFPENNSDWWNLGYSGSLEQKITSLDEIKELAEKGVMVNLFWQAQIADLKVRTNGDLIDWLESENTWYTTWGEAYSYEFHRVNDVFELKQNSSINWEIINNGSGIETLAWDVPTTRGFNIGENIVLDVSLEGNELQELTLENKTLISGWRQDDGVLWMTLQEGQHASITLKNTSEINYNFTSCEDSTTNVGCIMMEKPRFFNNHSWALTISGHHTIDLFKWSMKFDESPLVFTWLVEPQEVEDFSWLLIIIAATAGLGAVTYTRYLLTKDLGDRETFESE